MSFLRSLCSFNRTCFNLGVSQSDDVDAKTSCKLIEYRQQVETVRDEHDERQVDNETLGARCEEGEGRIVAEENLDERKVQRERQHLLGETSGELDQAVNCQVACREGEVEAEENDESGNVLGGVGDFGEGVSEESPDSEDEDVDEVVKDGVLALTEGGVDGASRSDNGNQAEGDEDHEGDVAVRFRESDGSGERSEGSVARGDEGLGEIENPGA